MGLPYNIFIAAFCSLGSFLFGGIIASVLTFDAFKSHFNNPSPSLTGAVVSTFNGGCFFGALAAGWLNDKLGRKRTVQVGSVIGLWGCAMQTGADNIGTLLAGRIIGGFSIGMLSMSVPLYNTEISPPKIRGFLVGLAQQMIGIGFIVANWVGYGSQYLSGNTQWRLPLALQMLPAFLLFVGIHFLPFSPRWLLEVGRDDEAKQVVLRLHGTNTPNKRKSAEQEYVLMYDNIKAEVSTRARRYSDLWATRAMLNRTLVSVGVQVFGQFTGINVINYYGPTMYASLGIDKGRLLLIQGIYGAVGPITNIMRIPAYEFSFITLILDTVGRRKPLMFGAASLVALFSVLAAIIASYPPEDGMTNFAAQRAGIAMIFLMSIVFSLSFGPVSWVLASEVFPTQTRALGTSVATCANWAFNVMLSEVSPIGMANIGWKFYILFIVLNTIDFLVIALFFPETKGRSLEEMAEVFGDARSPQALDEAHEKAANDRDELA
ncbi:general substrate transporter [Artomyces pyxidatus]|uniref:General substrate transporter n=1 Tax=Artomyces pyxidatus TaxID=48021 RepID=A0ACB8TFL0_9AGAM|nr:general substrate transporter [Artomyces pyxidatus]